MDVALVVAVRAAVLRKRLQELVRAREQLESAQAQLEATRQATHDAMRRLGSAYLAADERAPTEILRELYWDHPDVHVAALEAGVSEGLVARAAGTNPTHVRTIRSNHRR